MKATSHRTVRALLIAALLCLTLIASPAHTSQPNAPTILADGGRVGGNG
jgi:hypothetical protein